MGYCPGSPPWSGECSRTSGSQQRGPPEQEGAFADPVAITNVCPALTVTDAKDAACATRKSVACCHTPAWLPPDPGRQIKSRSLRSPLVVQGGRGNHCYIKLVAQDFHCRRIARLEILTCILRDQERLRPRRVRRAARARGGPGCTPVRTKAWKSGTRRLSKAEKEGEDDGKHRDSCLGLSIHFDVYLYRNDFRAEII